MGNAGVPIMVVVQKCILTSAANSTRKQLLVYNTHTHTKKKASHSRGRTAGGDGQSVSRFGEI